MHYACPGGHNAEVVKGILAPLQEPKPFPVPVELHFLVFVGTVFGTAEVCLDAMVDD
jgi:hypothetical protein